MSERILTAEEVRRRFHYDPSTGIFSWRDCYFQSKNGARADRPNSDGYMVLSIDEHPYLAHRVAWFYMTGIWPAGDIDHRNGVIYVNRFENLRDVAEVINTQNQRRPHRDNSTGFLGVSRHGNGFQARISIKGKTKFLGTHPTPEAAHAAYVAAKRQHHKGCTI